jgi:hypothetical protein
MNTDKAEQMRMMIFLAMALSAGFARGEVSCFRTPAQAAVGVGEQEGGGYRLEFVRRDALGGRTWARVRNCAHPEWPGVLVRSAVRLAAEPHLNDDKAVIEMVHPEMVAGKRVRVVSGDAMVRLQMTGVAQASGRVGELIQVRILAPGGDGEGRMEVAVIRSPELLELVQEAR